MTKTYCDVCKAEMKTNYAKQPVTFHLHDRESGHNLQAQVNLAVHQFPEAHLCVTCAVRVVRDGTTMATA